jgi:hypothetical protein
MASPGVSAASGPIEPIEYPARHQALIPAPHTDPDRDKSWMDDGFKTSPDGGPQSIFCNRTLDMSSMEAIGFDMVRRGMHDCNDNFLEETNYE